MRKPRPKKIKRLPIDPVLDYERQLKADHKMQDLWFKHVLTKDESLELIRFYCRKIGQCHDVSDPAVYNELIQDMHRIMFLAKNMDNRK